MLKLFFLNFSSIYVFHKINFFKMKHRKISVKSSRVFSSNNFQIRLFSDISQHQPFSGKPIKFQKSVPVICDISFSFGKMAIYLALKLRFVHFLLTARARRWYIRKLSKGLWLSPILVKKFWNFTTQVKQNLLYVVKIFVSRVSELLTGILGTY